MYLSRFVIRQRSTVQSQKAVSVNFTSELILPFGLAEQTVLRAQRVGGKLVSEVKKPTLCLNSSHSHREIVNTEWFDLKNRCVSILWEIPDSAESYVSLKGVTPTRLHSSAKAVSASFTSTDTVI